MSKRRGFTLTETLVMVAVVGIIAVITIVSLRNMRPNKDAAMLRKAYSEMSKVVYSLANDEQLYPSAKVAYNMKDYILFDETNFFAALCMDDRLDHSIEDAVNNPNDPWGMPGTGKGCGGGGGGGGGGGSTGGKTNTDHVEMECMWDYAADGSKKCIDGCHLVGDVCKPDCPEGSISIGTKCKCPDGQTVEFGTKECPPPKLECPEGSTKKGTKCECPDGQTVELGASACPEPTPAPAPAPAPKDDVVDPDGGGGHSWLDKLTSSFASDDNNGNGTSSNVTTGNGDLSSGGIAIGTYDTKSPHNISGRKIFTNTEVPTGATAYSATNKFAYNFMNGFDTKQTSLNGKVATFTTADGMKWTVTDNFNDESNPYAEVSVDIRGKGKANDTYYFYIDAGGGISLISGRPTTAKGKNLLTNRSIKAK